MWARTESETRNPPKSKSKTTIRKKSPRQLCKYFLEKWEKTVNLILASPKNGEKKVERWRENPIPDLLLQVAPSLVPNVLCLEDLANFSIHSFPYCGFFSRWKALLRNEVDFASLKKMKSMCSQSPDLPLPHGLAPSETMV